MAESDPGAMSVSTRDELILMIYISKLLARFLPTMGMIYRHLKIEKCVHNFHKNLSYFVFELILICNKIKYQVQYMNSSVKHEVSSFETVITFRKR